jgi:hypothetical protein
MLGRNWVSFAPVGAGIVVILMLLATALVNHRNEYACAVGAAGCRAAASADGIAALLAPDGAAGRAGQPNPSLAGQGEGSLTAWPASHDLLGGTLALLVVSLAVLVAVARQQWRIDSAQRAADDGKAATNERILKLFESVAAVIRALEERTRELESGVGAFATGSATHEKGLAAVAAVLERARTDQLAGARLAAETAERLDRAVASMAEEIGNYRQMLVDDLLPSIARRDERLVAIDANLTAVTDRLSRLSGDTQHNLQETAVLTEVVRALQRSLSGPTGVSTELRRSPLASPARPPDVATSPAPAPASGPSEAAGPLQASDTATESRKSTVSDEAVPGPSAPSDEAVGSDRDATADEAAGPHPGPRSGNESGAGAAEPQQAPSDRVPDDDG